MLKAIVKSGGKVVSYLLFFTMLVSSSFIVLPQEASALANGTVWNFGYTGGAQSFTTTVPGTYQLEVGGAQGSSYYGIAGGAGGYAVGTVSLAANETIYIYIGGSAGYNGGGTGGYEGANGGGATDIRRYGSALSNRIIVAGGGGGCGDGYGGGVGGGNSGTAGGGGYGGAGGTQTTGAALGQGGPGDGGGGGGGYYGGGGGGSYSRHGGDITGGYGGGGGSGYIGGVQNGSMQTGVQSGNGYARITFFDVTAPTINFSQANGSSILITDSVTISATDPDDAVSTLYYKWDSNSYNSSTSSTSQTVSPPGLGTHTLYAYATDSNGNIGSAVSASYSVTLQTPTGLSASAVSPSQINLNWNASTGASSYVIYNASTGMQIGTSATSSFSVTNLSANTTYSFYVKASNWAGYSSASNTASATTWLPVPAAPTGLIANAVSQSEIDLSWVAPAYATSYKVYRNGALISSPTSTSYSSTGLSPSTTYQYYVIASNSTGDSPASSTANATTWIAIPSAPTGLSATAVSTSQINLSWNASTGATSYKIYNSSGTLIDTTPGTSYSITGLSQGTTYSYYVKASNSSGDSGASSIVSAKTNTPATGVTLNPTTLNLTAGSSSTLATTVSPSSATNKNVTWSSDNTSIATVDSTGKVTAVNKGSATITVTTVDGGYTATCVVTIPATIPTLTSQSAASSSGSWNYGDSATVTASGTNINAAAVRIYYSNAASAPTVPAAGGDPLAAGWSDSNIAYTSPTITGGTSVTQAVPSSDIGAWNYIMFKVWVQSVTGDQVWNFTQAYKINNLPAPPAGSGAETLIDKLASNQLIPGMYSPLETGGNIRTFMPVVDPYTPAEPYNSTDAAELQSHILYQNGDTAIYRFEFDAVDASKINDIKAVLDFNSGNEDSVKVVLTNVDLYKETQHTSSAYPGQNYYSYALIKKSLPFTAIGRKNRYSIALGNDDSGNPIIQANGNGRYAIQVSATINIYQIPIDMPPLSSMTTEISMRVLYTGGEFYTGVLDPYLPSNKNYIQTELTRMHAVYR